MTVFMEIKAQAPFILSKQITQPLHECPRTHTCRKITEQSFSTLQRLRRCFFSTVPGKDELCQAGITTEYVVCYDVMTAHLGSLSVCHSIGNHGKSHLELLFGLFSGTLQYVESKVHIFFKLYLFIFLHFFSPIFGLDFYFFPHTPSTTNHQQKHVFLSKC